MYTSEMPQLPGHRLVAIAASLLLAILGGCGGGGGSRSTTVPPVISQDTDTFVAGVFELASNFRGLCAVPRSGIDPATGTAFSDSAGTELDENNWLRSWSNDLYLWYDEIADVNPQGHSTEAYFDLMKTFATTPSGAARDKFHFTFPTDEWQALSQSGVAAGYGVTFAILAASPPRRGVVAYTEPGSQGGNESAGLSRGASVLTIDGVDFVNANSAAEIDILNAGLFPSDIGETHQFTIQDLGADAPRDITLVSALITSVPVQNVSSIDTLTGSVGYLLFNDHIATAEVQLIDAVRQLQTAQISDLVIDLRYNGGGFLDIANEFAFMIAGPAAASGRTFDELRFNDKHTVFNPVTGRLLEPSSFLTTTAGFSTTAGQPLPSLDLARVYVLTGPGTCSASETIINGLRGIDIEVIQIGSTTCGKPYGFFPFDNCGTTYFSIQFKGVNAQGFGDYTDGFSPANLEQIEGIEIPGCSVPDDFTHELGDPGEARLAAALNYRMDGSCPAVEGLANQRSARSTAVAPLSAIDGYVPKTIWLQNRIMSR